MLLVQQCCTLLFFSSLDNNWNVIVILWRRSQMKTPSDCSCFLRFGVFGALRKSNQWQCWVILSVLAVRMSMACGLYCYYSDRLSLLMWGYLCDIYSVPSPCVTCSRWLSALPLCGVAARSTNRRWKHCSAKQHWTFLLLYIPLESQKYSAGQAHQC